MPFRVPPIALIAFAVSLLPSPASSGAAPPPDFVPTIGAVSPSVGVVLAKDENGQEVASGTAFVAAPDGVLLTALQVVDQAHAISVQLPGRPAAQAYVVGVDVDHDLALLTLLSLPAPLPPALPLDESGAVPVGQKVVVVGYPLLSRNDRTLVVTQGIVSALGARHGALQFDAAVNPGEAGAPVLTADGRVIGIVDWSVRGAQNVNFAVPGGPAAVLVRHSPGADLSQLPLNLPLPLPLTSPEAVRLDYGIGNLGAHGHDTRLGARCAPPPPHAAVLEGLTVTVDAPAPARVITWLSWAKGEPVNSPVAFARADATSKHQLSGSLGPVRFEPETVCLNFQAWNDTVVPIGVAFSVTYTRRYRVFTPAVLAVSH